MAWSWTHSTEAYENAESNLQNLTKEDLEIIFAEWRAAQGKGGIIEDSDSFCQKKYERALRYAKTLDTEYLAGFIWKRASEHKTCDNGGFNAYVCPSGCHTVSFDAQELVDCD